MNIWNSFQNAVEIAGMAFSSLPESARRVISSHSTFGDDQVVSCSSIGRVNESQHKHQSISSGADSKNYSSKISYRRHSNVKYPLGDKEKSFSNQTDSPHRNTKKIFHREVKWFDKDSVNRYKSRIKEIDNGFFELYGEHLLSQSSMNFDQQREQQQLPSDETMIPSISAFNTETVVKLSKEDLDLLYVEVLYTIRNMVGKTKLVISENKTSAKEQLCNYAREAFGYSEYDHQRFLCSASLEEPPTIVLNVSVIDAMGLEAKDPGGFSDPYCMLGIWSKSDESQEEESNESLINKTSNNPYLRKKSLFLPHKRPSISLPTNAEVIHHHQECPISDNTFNTNKNDFTSKHKSSKSHRRVSIDAANFSLQQNKNERKNSSNVACHFLKLFRSDVLNTQTRSLEELTGKGRHNRLDQIKRDSSDPKNHKIISHIDVTGQQRRNSSFMTGPGIILAATAAAIPARCIRATSVKSNTLSPFWNEKFRFDIENISTDSFHLDIWDHDNERSVLDSVKKLNSENGIRGLGRYFQQIAHSTRAEGTHDFLGSVNIDVKDIPPEGLDKRFALEGTKESLLESRGSLRLKIWLSTREYRGLSVEDERSNEIYQHQKIFNIFLEHELSQHKDFPWDWEGQLTDPASTILYQHRIQGDLTELQLETIRWKSLVGMKMRKSISFKILFETLLNLESRWENDSLSAQEEATLADTFTNFINYCMSIIQHHRKLFVINNPMCSKKLEFLLRCLRQISEMKTFYKCCASQQRIDIHLQVREIIEKTVTNRILSLIQDERIKNRIEENDVMTAVKSINYILNYILKELNVGRAYYEGYFNRILDISYLFITYKTAENMIFQLIVPLVEDIFEMNSVKYEFMQDHESWQCQSSSDHLTPKEDESFDTNYFAFNIFQMILLLDEIIKFRQYLNIETKGSFLMYSLPYSWFIIGVRQWIIYASLKLNARMEHLMIENCDTLVIEDDEIWHSSSCREFTLMLFYIKNVCQVIHSTTLSLSDEEASSFSSLDDSFETDNSKINNAHNKLNISKIIVDIICQAASVYAETIQNLFLEENDDATEGISTDEAALPISQKLYIACNNIEYTLQNVEQFFCDLSFQNVIISREKSEKYNKITAVGLSPILETTKTETDQIQASDLAKFIDSSLEFMNETVYSILEIIGKKIQNDLRKKIFHLAWSPDTLPIIESISPLLEFLSRTFSTLEAHLLKENFIRCVLVIWEKLLEELDAHTNPHTGEKMPIFFERLLNALKILLRYFSRQKKDFSTADFITDKYNQIRRNLILNTKTTEELIDLYYHDQLASQQTHRILELVQYGTLFVRVYFENNCIFVNVIKAQNIIALDSNGLSDPFVIVELLPKRLFPNVSEQQTRIQKATLNPVFDASFEFTASLEQCRDPNALISFTVMDYDVLSSNDFGGECFVSIKDIPGVAQHDQNNACDFSTDVPKPISLILMFRNRDNLSIQILDSRSDDKMAHNFVKKHRFRSYEEKQIDQNIGYK